MGALSATVGGHVWLKPRALPTLSTVYPKLDADAIWEVVQVDGGYGREALWLKGADGRLIMAWRGQCLTVPRCDYCSLEGHTASKGTAKTCPVRAAEVAEQRKLASARMKALWAEKKARGETLIVRKPAPKAPEPEAVPF